jgi:hypothetical protein
LENGRLQSGVGQPLLQLLANVPQTVKTEAILPGTRGFCEVILDRVRLVLGV